MVCFKLSRHLLGETQVNHENIRVADDPVAIRSGYQLNRGLHLYYSVCII